MTVRRKGTETSALINFTQKWALWMELTTTLWLVYAYLLLSYITFAAWIMNMTTDITVENTGQDITLSYLNYCSNTSLKRHTTVSRWIPKCILLTDV